MLENVKRKDLQIVLDLVFLVEELVLYVFVDAFEVDELEVFGNHLRIGAFHDQMLGNMRDGVVQ